ncbi:MAG: DUF4912 domain-containing protein [Alphaproteobacteria bacterium]
MLLPHVYNGPILFAIARDERTIFVSWNIDWPGIFRKNMPADRQVYLRVCGSDGSEQKIVPVEPMLAVHYLTTSSLRGPHRVEIGYYQPAGRWHSVAISDEVSMSQKGSTGISGIDLATIPFHLRFQKLVNLFGTANGTPLAKVVSKFQNFALNSQPNKLPAATKHVLRKLNLSLPVIAAARRDFERSDTKKLARHRRALLQSAGTSPSRGFEGNAGV